MLKQRKKVLAVVVVIVLALAITLAASLAGLRSVCSASLEGAQHQVETPQPGNPENRPHSSDKREQRTETPQVEAHVGATVNINAPVINQVAANQGEGNPQGKKNDWGHSFVCESKLSEVALSLLTLALVIVTAILAFYTFGLWDETRKLVRDTTDTSHIELRPYIGVEQIEFTLEGTGHQLNALLATPDLSILKLRIKNYGKTPGYSVSVFALVLDEIPKDEYFASYRPTFDAPVFRGQVIYPDQSDAIDLDPYRSPLAKFRGGIFYVYGKITYYDPLRKFDWTLEFCRAYMGANHFTPHGTYNQESGIGRGPS